MNIALTNACPRRCPFCYQSDVMARAKAMGDEEMSLEALRRLVDFAEASGERRLTLVGGEPTLHRDFAKVLKLLCARPALQQILLFTNGLFGAGPLEAIVSNARKLIISVNVLAPGDQDPRLLRCLRANLEELVRRRIGFDLSYVIYRPDFDYEFLLDYVDRYSVGALRWALAFPVVPGAAFVAREDLPRVGSRIVAMLQALEARRVHTYVDCPLPYCLFDDEQLGYVSRQALSVINWGYCGLTLEVNPDLTVKACPSQRDEERVPLLAFSGVAEMERYFFARMSAYRAAHQLFEHCTDCRYHQQARCQGGCLSYSRDAFSSIPLAETRTLGNGDIPSEWRIRPIPRLSVWPEQDHRVLGSTASRDVRPEPLNAETEAYWTVLAGGPTFGEAVAAFPPGVESRLGPFVRRLQHCGFVDLVAEP